MSNWIETFLEESEEEVKLREQITEACKKFNNSPEVLKHNEEIHSYYKQLSEIIRKRREKAREKRNADHQERKPLDEEAREKLRKDIAKKKEEEFKKMPLPYITAVLAYNKLTPEMKRKFKFETFDNEIDEIPQHENPKTTDNDIHELQEILVNDVIDFINEKGLQEIDAVHFNVDGLKGSYEYGEWTSSTDSSITVEGLKDYDGIPGRTIIGHYC